MMFLVQSEIISCKNIYYMIPNWVKCLFLNLTSNGNEYFCLSVFLSVSPLEFPSYIFTEFCVCCCVSALDHQHLKKKKKQERFGSINI